jgi:hypothetical protein
MKNRIHAEPIVVDHFSADMSRATRTRACPTLTYSDAGKPSAWLVVPSQYSPSTAASVAWSVRTTHRTVRTVRSQNPQPPSGRCRTKVTTSSYSIWTKVPSAAAIRLADGRMTCRSAGSSGGGPPSDCMSLTSSVVMGQAPLPHVMMVVSRANCAPLRPR